MFGGYGQGPEYSYSPPMQSMEHLKMATLTCIKVIFNDIH